jgi:hypothetical protein
MRRCFTCPHIIMISLYDNFIISYTHTYGTSVLYNTMQGLPLFVLLSLIAEEINSSFDASKPNIMRVDGTKKESGRMDRQQVGLTDAFIFKKEEDGTWNSN